MAFRDCVKTVLNLNDEDAIAIIDAYDTYKAAGYQESVAIQAAINDALETVEGERADYYELINDQRPAAPETVGRKLTDQEKADLKKGIYPQEIIDAHAVAMAMPQTYKDESAERQALRDAAVDATIELGGMIDGVATDVKQEKQMYIIMGPPASGKSSSVAEPLARIIGGRIIDADVAKAQFPEFQNGLGSNALHAESVGVKSRALLRSMKAGDNIVYPAVGKTQQSIEDEISRAQGRGYEVSLYYVDIPVEVAIERAVQRFFDTGRYVPPDYIRESVDSLPPAVYDILFNENRVNNYAFFNNNVRYGEKPLLEEERTADSTGVSRKLVESGEERERDRGPGEIGAEPGREEISGRTAETGRVADERPELPAVGEPGVQEAPAGPGTLPVPAATRRDEAGVAAGQPADVSELEGAEPTGQAVSGIAGEDVGREGPADTTRAAPEPGRGRGDEELAPVGTGRTADGRERPADSTGTGTPLPPSAEGSGSTKVNRNFHADNPLEIVGGGQVARFEKNKSAIELYHQLEADDRLPTDEEKNTLAGYTGWGSFGQELFQGTWGYPRPKKGWEKRDAWLRKHLGQSEWESAQRSITNSHYTDPPTVMAMWDMVRRMGFEHGRVLEPALGIGNFYAMMPIDMMHRSDLTGIELDEVTGGIAKLLYPDANISIKPYQDSKTPDNFYDLIIGNWPFEDTVIADRRYNKLKPYLHDYFYLKALDQVRPGGLVVAITSKGTLDKLDKTIRLELAKKAELVSAFRLPTGAFKEYAGTDVVTDIIILKKREAPVGMVTDNWIESVPWKVRGTDEKPNVNQYYHDNKNHVIGTIGWGDKTTYFRKGLEVKRPPNMQNRLTQAAGMVPEGIYSPREKTDTIAYITNHTDDREGSMVEQKGEFYVVQGERLAKASDLKAYAIKDKAATKTRVDQLSQLLGIRKQYAALLESEYTEAENTEQERKTLRRLYDEFVDKHGSINDSWGLKYIGSVGDPFYATLSALENNTGTEQAPQWTGAAILDKSTVRKRISIENPTIVDAFVIARNQSVNPSLDEIAKLANKPEAEVLQELLSKQMAFETGDGDIVPHDIYLSGNVREKLRIAQAMVDEGHTELTRNVNALKNVLPETIPYHKIEVRMGASWIDNETYEQYVAHMLNLSEVEAKQVKVSYTGGRWQVDMPAWFSNKTEASAGYGSDFENFKRLVRYAMSNQTITIRHTSGEQKGQVWEEATAQAGERIEKIRNDFAEWVWSTPERRVRLESEYNEARNAWADPDYDGTFLEMSGMALERGNKPLNLREHQLNAIWRALVNRKSINAHEVGTGKTFTIGGIAVESRRFGVAKKPMLFAHNANSKAVATSIQAMYPGAKILYINNLDKKTIATKLRQIANDDWDLIVVPHSLIDRMSLREDTLMAMAQEEIAALEQEAREAAEEDNVNFSEDVFTDEEELKKLRSVTAKNLVKQRNRIINKIQRDAQRSTRENAVTFEELGVDMILVDEAHIFKKPSIVTKMRMRGLNTEVSNRSLSLQYLTRFIRGNNNGGNVHLFTGTPITNTLTEIYHHMRYIMEEEMASADLNYWDGWFGSFASEVTDVELNAAAEYENITRLAAFINVPELRKMIGQYMDVVFSDDMPEMQPRKTDSGKTLDDPTLNEAERMELLNGRTEGAHDRPYKKVINDTADMTAAQLAEFQQLQQYARTWRNMGGKARMEAMRKGDPESPIITEGLAAKASFDVRLLAGEKLAGKEGEAADEPNSKATRVVNNVLEVYNSHKMATQVIFTELGISDRVTRTVREGGEPTRRTFKAFSTVKDIVERLVDQGIPRNEIAIVSGNTSKEKRQQISDAMNRAEIRVVIGSTQTLGTGVNMQHNLRAMHHLDAPWMPGELEQRNGRGHRQKNQWNTVLEYRYITDRLDGRRWQVLAIKQRFIKEFLTATGDTRVIEGEAAADEQNDILQTFSDASGDPRVLIRVKLQKQIEKLQQKERMHTYAVNDAQRKIGWLEERIEREERQLTEAGGFAETVTQALQDNAGDKFSAKLKGKTYTTRKGADKALDTLVSHKNVSYQGRPIKLGTIMGLEVSASWPKHAEKPVIEIKIGEDKYLYSGNNTVQSVAAVLRGYTKQPANIEKSLEEDRSSLVRMRDIAVEPFALADKLADTEKQLAELERDMETNPVPPPAWLRQGAPVDTEVYHNGTRKLVTGHKWTNDGYFVIAGDEAIPYMNVRDEQGIQLYEQHDFNAPEVITSGPGQTVPTAPAPEVSPTENIDTGYLEVSKGISGYFALTPGGIPYAGQPAEGFKTEQEARNWMLSEKPEGIGVLFSRDSRIQEKPRKSIDPDRLRKIAARIQENYKGVQPITIHVRDTQYQAFGGLILGRTKGGFFTGSNDVVLIAENITDDADAIKVLRHELVGHYGFRQLLNDEGEYDTLLGRVYDAREGELKALYDRVARAYPDLVRDNKHREIADEMIAFGAEMERKPSLVTKILDAITKLLHKYGLITGPVSRKELNSLIRLSEKNLRDKQIQPRVAEDAVMASREPQIESPEFKAWFGDSKVVNPDGSPMVVYRGEHGGHQTDFQTRADTLTFTPEKYVAGDYAADDIGARVGAYYLSIQNPLDINLRGGEDVIRLGTLDELFPNRTPKEEALLQSVINEAPNWRGIPGTEIEGGINFFDPDNVPLDIQQERNRRGGAKIEEAYTDTFNIIDRGAFVDLARGRGYDGVRYYGPFQATDRMGVIPPGLADRLEIDGELEIRPFSENQVKSAWGNRGTFDPESANILQRRQPQTESPEFKTWFSGSEVVDEQGEPLRVYHGTVRDFDTFKRTSEQEPRTSGGGLFSAINVDFHFFTDEPSVADDYAQGLLKSERGKGGAAVYPVYLSIKNPLIIDAKDRHWSGLMDKVRDAQWDGHDGAILKNIEDTFTSDFMGAETATTYIVFNNRQIKSAVGNIGTFDPANEDIRYRRVEPEQAPVGSRLGMPEETYVEGFVRLFQNAMNRVRKLQETIEATGGTVTYESDVYLTEELSSGKITARLVQLDNQYMKPLIKTMQDNGISLEELDDYLEARHAPERNAYIASINPDMPDGGSGITTAQAHSYMDGLSEERINQLQSAAQYVYGVNTQNLDDLVEGGHLESDVVDEWRDRWNAYVPLKGKEGEQDRPKVGRGYSVTGSAIKAAMGRGAGNRAESPTAHTFAQAESTIVRTEKTKVGQALVQLIRDNPDPAFWTIGKRTFKRFEDLFGEPFEGYEEEPEGLIEGLDYHRVKAVTKTERQKAVAEGRTPVAKVVYKLDPGYRHRDEVFGVMIEGQELLINIKDPIVAEQLKRMNAAKLGTIVAAFGQVNRYLAMINTALNPEFVITNFERDIQTAMVNLSGEQSAAMAAQVAKNVPHAIRGIWQSTFDTRGESPWRAEYEEMQREGGTIGFFGLEDIEARGRRIQNRLEINNTVLGRTKRGILTTRDIVLDANLSVENAARLSAYKVAKDRWISNGMPADEARAKAASLAKNLTVNFNRKGEWGPALNSAYLFYNASIQGSARIFTALRHPRVRKIVGGVFAAAFALPFYNREMGGDDDDDIPYWDKISSYTKQTNLIVMKPDGSGEYWKIRLPYGYNVFWYTGTAINDMMFGKGADKTPTATAMNILSAVMNAFNPIQGADFLDTITPTILKPLEQDVRNQNFMGSGVRPENPFDQYERPDSEKYFKSTNPVLVEMMQAMNEATGGDPVTPGWFDVSPETIKHYVGWLTGGAGMTVTRALDTTTNLITGEDIEQRNVPLLRTIGGKPGPGFDYDRYYEAQRQVAAVRARLNQLRGTQEWSEYKADNEEVHKLGLVSTKFRNRISDLRDKRDAAYAEDDYDAANDYREQMRQVMMEFSTRYDDAIAAQQ